jgi:hypothetical protein
MALYIPAGRRRRRTILIAAGALLIGLALGAMAGRSTAPTIGDRISSVRSEAQKTSAALRVIALHDESGAVSAQGGDGGTDLVLQRTRTDLDHLFARAPWLPATTRQKLLDDLASLAAKPDKSDASFGAAAEALAQEIDATFG